MRWVLLEQIIVGVQGVCNFTGCRPTFGLRGPNIPEAILVRG